MQYHTAGIEPYGSVPLNEVFVHLRDDDQNHNENKGKTVDVVLEPHEYRSRYFFLKFLSVHDHLNEVIEYIGNTGLRLSNYHQIVTLKRIRGEHHADVYDIRQYR